MANLPPNSYDLDTGDSFKSCTETLSSPSTHNFAVEFDVDRAVCAIDLDADEIVDFLVTKQSQTQAKCRWLNVWVASKKQKAAVKAVLAHYHVSPRLTHLLCPDSPLEASEDAIAVSSVNQNSDAYEEVIQLEKGPTPTNATTSGAEARQNSGSRNPVLGILDVVKDLWHFCSIDWGQRYVCLGFNALFTSADMPVGSTTKPDAIRIWSALLLCDDGTVLSIFETPQDVRPSHLKTLRKNQINIFKHLSRCYDQSSLQNPLFQVNIRPMPAPANNSNTHVLVSEHTFDSLTVASLLFYYLFDDWRATFDLVSGREHPYRAKLEFLRRKMTQFAEVHDIEALHLIGRQLTVLQKVYQSYETIVDNLLQRQRQLASSSSSTPSSNNALGRHFSETSITTARNAQNNTATNDNSDDNDNTWATDAFTTPPGFPQMHPTIRLPLATTARFERLLARIKLYALTEITECLAEKESLVLMNFNLVQLKTTFAMERLTRTTILLAKATILFLPVSLMTGYFSIQLSEIENLYSLRTYWACFGVVAGVTLLLLGVFDFASERVQVQGAIVYRSLTQMAVGRVLGWKGTKRKEGLGGGGR